MSKHASKDRASLCLYAYADGRRCTMPRAADPYLCNYHARREAEKLAAQRIGRDISGAFYGDQIISATGLSLALARTLAATAQGHIKPKTAAIIAYLGQTLVQAIQQANQEYVQVFGSHAWREAIRSCFEPALESSPPTPEPTPDATPDPAPTPPSAPDNAATQPANDNAAPTPTSTTAASPTTTHADAASSAPSAKGADVSDSERAPNAAVASSTDVGRDGCSRGLQTAGFRANGKHNPTPPATPAPSAQLTSTKSPQHSGTKPPLPKDAKSFANEVLSHLKH